MSFQHLPTNILTSLRELCLHSNVAFKHSAIIFKGSSKIVAMGHNCDRGCVNGTQILTAHAEMSAIFQLLRSISAGNVLRMGANKQWCFLRRPASKEKVV